MRSKSSPLDITINFGPRLEYATSHSIDDQVYSAVDLFRPVLWRIQSFSLTVPNRPQAYTALLRCQEDAPILKHLTIHVYHAMQDDIYSKPFFPLFNGCTPNLRICSLTSFNFGWDPRLMTGLSVLKLGGYFNSFAPSSNTLLEVLRQCPELEELSLKNMSNIDTNSCDVRMAEDDVPVTSKILLPRLKTASFYYSGVDHVRDIMSHVLFPNLETLELAYLENVNPLLQELYAQALTRLPVKKLRIESCLFSEMKFVNLLRKLPSLAILQLVDIEDISYITLKVLNPLCVSTFILTCYYSGAFISPTMDVSTARVCNARWMYVLRLGLTASLCRVAASSRSTNVQALPYQCRLARVVGLRSCSRLCADEEPKYRTESPFNRSPTDLYDRCHEVQPDK